MERFSKINERVRLPLTIRIPPYLMDHQFQGRAVLPALEAMEILAASTQAQFPEAAFHTIRNARFDKFLTLKKEVNEIRAFNELEILDDGQVVSKLITKSYFKKAKITRTLEHAVLHFANSPLVWNFNPPKFSEGKAYHVSSETIYTSLVPFGPAYHNLKGGVNLWKNGAEAEVCAPDFERPVGPLGSPFPLDAAFHAACVWGQRYAGFVGFPVAFGLRHVFSPTRPGKSYTAIILPKSPRLNHFLVDIWIAGTDGAAKEAALDVVMKDVSGGRMIPAVSIVKDDDSISVFI